MRGRFALLFAVLLVAVSTAACRRKAPGPAECRKLALALAGVTDAQELRPNSQLKNEVDELTRECLVTPYDRELLRCVEESGRFRACRSAFALRHGKP